MGYGVIILKRDNARDLQFVGKLLAMESARTEDKDRWTDILLFETQGGKYVCQTIGRTTYPDEVDRFSAYLCENKEDVFNRLRGGWLAKKIYQAVGWDYVETIE